MLKNFNSSGFLPIAFSITFMAFGPWTLEAVRLALAIGAQRRTLVELDLHVILAGRGMEHHPVERRGAANEVEFVFGKVEQDDVADDVTFGSHRHELLGLVRLEALVAVHRQIREQLQRVRTFDREIGHVIGLVEQHAGFLPGLLLVTPVGVFGRHTRINVRSGLLIAQQLDRILHAVQYVFQSFGSHRILPRRRMRVRYPGRRYAPVYNFRDFNGPSRKRLQLWAYAHLQRCIQDRKAIAGTRAWAPPTRVEPAVTSAIAIDQAASGVAASASACVSPSAQKNTIVSNT
jgi:hypothetical protein